MTTGSLMIEGRKYCRMLPAFCNTFDLSVLVFLRVAVLHRHYCTGYNLADVRYKRGGGGLRVFVYFGYNSDGVLFH